MGDQVIRALSSAGGVRVLACRIDATAREICLLHGASLTATVALGRGLAGGALMGALLKNDQRVAMKFEGNGPLSKMIVEADSDGAIRGSLANPAADVEPRDGRWDVASLIGRAGFLTISKDLGIGGEPYHGTVQLHSSEIGDDIAYYLTESEQTPSAVGLGAVLDSSGSLSVCGGFLVQVLPRADDLEIDRIMTNISSLVAISDILQQGGCKELIEKLMDGVPYTLLEERDVFFRCGCGRDKVERALLTYGAKGLREMAAEDGGAAVTCEFCRQQYLFDQPEIEHLASTVKDS